MALAAHLMNTVDNDHVQLHELRGFVSDTLAGAFCEAYALSRATRCSNFLFSLRLNPPEHEEVSVAAFEKAAAEIETKLGLSSQPRALVFHEKNGRRHAHCVWSKIDGQRLKAINLSSYKRKLNRISQALFREHGWTVPRGYQNKAERDPLAFSQADQQQAKRADKDVRALKKVFQDCWAASDSKAALAAALLEHGLVLARGSQRAFVAVDEKGAIYSLSRWTGVQPHDLRSRLHTQDDLPSIDEAQCFHQNRTAAAADPAQEQKHVLLRQTLKALEAERIALVSRHRKARDALKARQEARHLNESRERSTHLPKGLAAVWSKMTGQYEAMKATIEADYLLCQARDLDALQGLIQAQLKERQALQHKIRQCRLAIGGPALKTETTPEQTLVLEDDSKALFTPDQIARKPERILQVLTDKQEYISRYDIARGLADYIDNPVALTTALESVMRSGALVKVEDGKPPVYTTKDFAALKAALMEQAQTLAATQRSGVSAGHRQAAIDRQNAALKKARGAKLSEEQVSAIHHILGHDQLSCVIGYAGSGKSTMLKAANKAWEAQGYRVHGAALSGKAADGLQASSGIQSRTLASLELSWEKGTGLLQPGDVLVIDEAGMIGTRQLKRFIDEADKQGAKLVLVGDPEQLQPINAGTPFRDLVNQIGGAALTDIHRQKEDWQRQATQDFASRRTQAALKAYDDHGAVKTSASLNEAIASLVQDYMVDLELRGVEASRLALAHRREDVNALNQAIRSARKAGGELEGEMLIRTRHGIRAFAPGDRIVFTHNDKTLGVRNGTQGTVRSVSKTSLAVDIPSNGQIKTLIFSPQRFDALDHGYATTIHKSQGMTVDKAFVLSSKGMDRHLTYVAMSRHRQSVRLYTTAKEWRRMGAEASRKSMYIRKRERRRTLH